MADDTRVTHARRALALTLVLIWALGCVLCARASAAEISKRTPAVPNSVRLHVAGTATAVSDPWYSLQWGLGNSDDTDIDVGEAWDNPLDRLGQGVDVAVVDQRVDASHPDLDGRVVEGPSFIGETDCEVGTPSREADHGTHVAGTIAAARDGKGTVG